MQIKLITDDGLHNQQKQKKFNATTHFYYNGHTLDSTDRDYTIYHRPKNEEIRKRKEKHEDRQKM
jgi:hypothetical protein